VLHKLIIAGLLSLIAGIALYVSLNRALWYDELLTLYLSRLPDLPTFWSALKTGPDLSPPLYDLCVRSLLPILGEHPTVLRLPALLAYLAMSYSIYKFVEFRYDFESACIAMVFPAITTGIKYAWEARPYGLLLGFTGLAVLSWQRACAATTRPLAIIGLALGVTGAIWTHYYGVLIVFPLLLGESARIAAGRKIDWQIGATIALCLATLPFLSPLIAHARAQSDTFWAKPELMQMVTFYTWLFKYSLLPIVGCASVALLFGPSTGALSSDDSVPRGFAVHERVAVAGLALLPVLAVIVSKLGTGAFTERYALPSLVGLGAMAGALAGWSARPARTMILLLLAVWIVALSTKALDPESAIGGPEQSIYQKLVQLEDRLPIVVADGEKFVQANHYADPSVARRLYWLSTGKSNFDLHTRKELGRLADWHPLNIRSLLEFADLNPEFFILDDPNGRLVAALKEEFPGASVRVVEGKIVRVRLRG
jgi:hypothetical protein